MSIDTEALRELRAKTTQGELLDGGRYFDESYADLTRCRHGETGEYLNPHNGLFIEALWNAAPALLDEIDRLRAELEQLREI